MITVQASDLVLGADISVSSVKFSAIDRVLRDVNGSSRSVVGQSGEVLIEFYVPCSIAMTPEAAVQARSSLRAAMQTSSLEESKKSKEEEGGGGG